MVSYGDSFMFWTFFGNIYGVLDVMRSVLHKWCQDGSEVLCIIVGDQVYAADDESEWAISLCIFRAADMYCLASPILQYSGWLMAFLFPVLVDSL